MSNIKKFIRISAEARKELAAKYKVSLAAVSLALNYEKKEGKSKWIRADALQMGGEIRFDIAKDLLIKVAKGEVELPSIVA